MGLPCNHRLKRGTLVKKKGTASATNSCYGNNKHVLFLKSQPELKRKKKKYIYIYIPKLSRADIYNEDGKQQDLKQRKWKPGKRCEVMFCNKTNADGVSLHQFPQTLDAGQYIWLLPAIVHCNILQIFIFDHIYFLVKDVVLLPPHWLAVSTLTPCHKKKMSKVAIFSRCRIEEIENITCMIAFTKKNSYQLYNCHKRAR